MRSRIRLYSLPLLCSGVLLLACSSPALRTDAGTRSVPAADDSYLRGRATDAFLARFALVLLGGGLYAVWSLAA